VAGFYFDAVLSFSPLLLLHPLSRILDGTQSREGLITEAVWVVGYDLTTVVSIR
jgi:hypothetical protein